MIYIIGCLFYIYAIFLSYDKLRVGKHLSDMFPKGNGLKKRRCFITIAFQLCFRLCH